MDKNTIVKTSLTEIAWRDEDETKPTELSFDVRAIFLYDFNGPSPMLMSLQDCKDIMKAYVLDELGWAIEDCSLEISV